MTDSKQQQASVHSAAPLGEQGSQIADSAQSTNAPSAYTPGPWEVIARGTHGGLKVMAGSMLVATVARSNNDFSYNARLIAAAPKLLEALDGLMELERRNRLMPTGREWDAARAAMAAASSGDTKEKSNG